MNSVKSNDISLKFEKFTLSDCKFDLVEKTQFFWNLLSIFTWVAFRCLRKLFSKEELDKVNRNKEIHFRGLKTGFFHVWNIKKYQGTNLLNLSYVA